MSIQEDKTERFVDEDPNPIPPRYTWDQLGFQQLMEIRVVLENRLYDAQKNKPLAKVLADGVQYITSLIDERVRT